MSALNLMLIGFLVGFGPTILRLSVESALDLTIPGGD